MTSPKKVRDESLPEVSETISDAAARILSHSFAVYRVDTRIAANIRAAHRIAVNFFREASRKRCDSKNSGHSNANETFVEQYRRIVNGNLYGYNVPLPSKELFRTWYDPRLSSLSAGKSDKGETNEGDDEQHFYQQQPWPSDEFCVQSFRVAKDLHFLLQNCLREISIALDVPSDSFGIKRKRTIPVSNVSQALLQRRNTDSTFIDNRSPKRYRKSCGSTNNPFGEESNQKTSVICSDMGFQGFRSASCPLDYFFYHNRLPQATNCTEHVDRGALVVVCLTDVPGLEVCAPSSSFHCPEALVHNASLYQERTENSRCSDLVCIMAGDQLSRLLTKTKSHGYQPISACIHRVRNPLKRARLSISYELRVEEC